MLALALANPVLAITQGEAAILAQAAGKVARHYPMQASAQTLDWAGLLVALITVYATRIFALRMKPAPQQPQAKEPWEPTIIQGVPQ